MDFDPCFKRTWKFSRELTDEQLLMLVNFNESAFKYTISQNLLWYIGHLFCAREYMGHGRLAGDLVDAVLRGICALSFAAAGQKKFNYLEIGILHGINFVATYDIARHYYQRVSFTAIDPFDGYYGKGVDRATGLPVTEELFRANLRLFAIPPADIGIYKGLSSDEAVQQAQNDKKFDMMFIDGDHSYQGLKLDYDFYGSLLKDNGLLIIDNYRDQAWPEVTRFVDDQLMNKPPPALSVLGVLGRTIVFRKQAGPSATAVEQHTLELEQKTEIIGQQARQLERLNQTIARQNQEIERQRAMRQQLKHSVSWRVTAPMRAVGRLFKK